MSVNGLLTQVQFVTRGSELTASAAIGATVLSVDSTVDFDDAGGDVEINGLRYGYKSADVDALTITLSTPLTVAVAADDFVASVAGGQVEVDAVAFVTIGEGDDAEVDVPFALRPMLPEGVYDDVPVLLSEDLETIDALPGRVPVIEGTTFQTGTTGQRVVIRELEPPDQGGVVEFYSGFLGEERGYIVAGISGSTTGMEISPPSKPTDARIPFMVLNSGTAVSGDSDGAVIRLSAPLVRVSEDFFAAGPITSNASVHGFDIYADNESGAGTVGASLTAQGRLIRTPSTRKAKKNIKPMTMAAARKVLELEPVTFNLRAEKNGPTYPGFVAEQAAEVGADLFVTHDDAGAPAGIRYPEMVAALVALAKEDRTRITKLEKQVKTLTARLNRKENR